MLGESNSDGEAQFKERNKEMKEIVRKISLDLSRETNKRYLFASQSDYNSRVFVISLFDDGIPFFVEKSMTALVNILRSDGTSWSYITDVTDDGCVYFVATLWTFEVPGETKFTVTLYDGERKITSSQFIVEVAEDLVGLDHTNEVAENLSLFQQAMEHFANINENESTRQENEIKREKAEKGRDNIEMSRMDAEKTRAEYEAVRCKNEAARVKVTDTMIRALDNLLTLQQIFIERGEAAV